MYEKELERAARLLENEFGANWKKIIQTLGVWDLTHCAGRNLTSFMAYPKEAMVGTTTGEEIVLRKLSVRLSDMSENARRIAEERTFYY